MTDQSVLLVNLHVYFGKYQVSKDLRAECLKQYNISNVLFIVLTVKLLKFLHIRGVRYRKGKSIHHL